MIIAGFISSYLISSFVFLLCDLFVPHLRIPSSSNRSQILKQYITFIPTVLFNILFISPIIMSIMHHNFIKYGNFTHRKMVLNLIFFYLIFEIWFHFAHRALHFPMIFKRIHYKHHEMRDCIGFGALYCHWFEFLFGNLFPAMAGPVLMQTVDCYSLLIWAVVAASHTVIAHSGYMLDKKGSHLIHHRKLDKNYGTIGIFDRLFGTRSI